MHLFFKLICTESAFFSRGLLTEQAKWSVYFAVFFQWCSILPNVWAAKQTRGRWQPVVSVPSRPRHSLVWVSAVQRDFKTLKNWFQQSVVSMLVAFFKYNQQRWISSENTDTRKLTYLFFSSMVARVSIWIFSDISDRMLSSIHVRLPPF